MAVRVMEFEEFAALYCERQQQTTEGLLEVLSTQRDIYSPDGWVMLECQMLDSSSLGSLVILAFGPNNTLKEIPTRPMSPRGLASDMSVAIAVLPADKLPAGEYGEPLWSVRDGSLSCKTAAAAFASSYWTAPRRVVDLICDSGYGELRATFSVSGGLAQYRVSVEGAAWVVRRRDSFQRTTRRSSHAAD